MKKSLKILLILLFTGLFLGFAGYSYYLSQIQIRLVGGNTGAAGNAPLKYHFVLIAQDMGDTFWQSVQSGAESAAKEYGAAVEYNGSMIQDENQELDDLNIAIASHVDGIIVYVTDETKFTPLINKARSDGIHVVTIESDDRSSNRDTFVGPTSYMAGLAEGNLVVEASTGTSDVAIILGGNYAGNKEAEDSLLKGFNDSIQNHPGISVKTTLETNYEYFSAETLIRNILSTFPEVNTVVCTGSDDTLEIVQVLLDLNKENSVTLIGYNNTPVIRNYIKNFDMYGSIYENPKQTGYQSVESLVNSLEGKTVPSFINTGVFAVTRSNLVSYPGDS